MTAELERLVAEHGLAAVAASLAQIAEARSISHGDRLAGRIAKAINKLIEERN